MKAYVVNAQKLQDIFALYGGQSGQLINKEKSAAMFNKGTKLLVKQAVLGVLGIPRSQGTSATSGYLFIWRLPRKMSLNI
jgi:hypothetical protein